MKNLESVKLVSEIRETLTHITEKLDELLDGLMETRDPKKQDELKGPTVFEIAAEAKSKIIKTDKYWFYRGYAFEIKDGMPYDERFGGYLCDEDVVYRVDNEINKLNDVYDDDDEE